MMRWPVGHGNTGRHHHSLCLVISEYELELMLVPLRGCVSGAQIATVREAISTGDDEYDFGAIDGYDEME